MYLTSPESLKDRHIVLVHQLILIIENHKHPLSHEMETVLYKVRGDKIVEVTSLPWTSTVTEFTVAASSSFLVLAGGIDIDETPSTQLQIASLADLSTTYNSQ